MNAIRNDQSPHLDRCIASLCLALATFFKVLFLCTSATLQQGLRGRIYSLGGGRVFDATYNPPFASLGNPIPQSKKASS
jgi:hypothetical protein